MKKILLILTLILLPLLASCDEEYECKHKNMIQNTNPATCTEMGYTEYLCADCDYSYVHSYTDPTGHSYTKTTTEPTCTKEGYTTYTCECGDSFISDYTDALAHNYKFTVTQPTCEEQGYTTYTCSLCSDSYVSYYTDAKGHRFTEEITAPTCTEQGYTTYTCDCGKTYQSKILSPLGHTTSPTVFSPTCENEGYTEYRCSCGYSYVSDKVAPTGHTYVEEVISEASCTSAGEVKYTCACSDSYTLIQAPLGHSFSRKVTLPSLSDMGYTEFSCSQCDYEYVGEYTFYSDILENAYSNNTEVLAHGIDISHHNYRMDSNGEYISLDWEAIKAVGVSYVIIRVGDAAIGIDPTFEKSYAEAKAAGLNVGVYFYTRATSVNEIELEANLVLSALKGKQFEYPIYLDLEDESLMSIDAALLNEMSMKFFTILQRAGYYTGLYVNDEWLYNVIDTETALSRFEIWYARYPAYAEGEIPTWNTEEFGETLGMWQYSDNGTLEGIDHTVFDINYCYKDYPTLIKEYGFNGYESDFFFPDGEKTFVWVIYESASVKIRSKSDYFTADDYDSELDIIGYAEYGTRFEVVEITDKYTAILYNGSVAYISANPTYISFDGIYSK